ncbi:MAG: HAD family hydrolase [Candidatus Aminicenantes bacterium]|nr:HAD family hydrolase [Candidatus Aminicenantes bacterium]
MKNRRAVFLDRDGTINKDVGYPGSYDAIAIYPYSFEAVRKLNKAGFLSVVVTNQSGVGRGLIMERDLLEIHDKMRDAFLSQKSRLDAIYYCPHYISSPVPEYRKDCTCRKPNPGMALKAVAELGIDIQNSYMIGDKTEDILFGLNIKATPILLLSGHGRRALKELTEKGIKPAHVAANLLAAVDWILARET